MIQELRDSMKRIEARLDKLEAKLEMANQADERSREALNAAEKAMAKALEAHTLAEKVENNQDWLWKVVIGALITSAISALFYFAQGG